MSCNHVLNCVVETCLEVANSMSWKYVVGLCRCRVNINICRVSGHETEAEDEDPRAELLFFTGCPEDDDPQTRDRARSTRSA